MDFFIDQIEHRNIPLFSGICMQCQLMLDRYSDRVAAGLFEQPLPLDMSTWMNKRKAEYVAGRYLAKLALNQLQANSEVVKTGANREPIWPKGFVGAISHTAFTAICAVSSVEEHQRIGLDMELVMTEKIALELHSSLLVPQEYDLVRVGAQINTEVFTGIFSAKESLYKALYPEVKRYFDFLDAAVTQIDLHNGWFDIQLVQSLTPELTAGQRFRGQISITQNQVFTSIIE